MVDVDKIWLFRIIPIQNLELILRNGMYCKNAKRTDKEFVTIGNKEIINQRDNKIVKCFPETVVNDFIPFYFSVRTPMLYNLITGYGVPAIPQKEIIYICCRLNELINNKFQWCFTDGNAAKNITKFSNNIKDLKKLDWRSIESKDFRDENTDGDEDRVRKKHAEFLVKDYVSVEYIKGIAVLNETVKEEVEETIKNLKLSIEVKIKPEFYFL
jgi:ssDNA thymidine ADP-ribosyltransferase, DarT